MKNRNLIAALLTAIISCVAFSCKDTGTGPDQKPFKDPRQMTWTVDTLGYPGSMQTIMESLWASSPNYVWIAGHNDRSIGNVWNFDGLKWKDVDPFRDIPVSTNSFSKVSGFSPNNIWLVGNRRFSDPLNPNNLWFQDLIIQYNGTKWMEHKQNSGSRIIGLHCNTPNDIWVGGDNGFIANYNGTGWKKDTLKIKISSGSFYFIKSIAKYNDKVFLLVSSGSPSFEKYYFAKGDLGNWNLADSIYYDGTSFNIKWGYWGLYTSPFGKLYSYGPGGIWEWQNGWINILKLNFPIRGMYGISNNYILAAGDYGYVYFYDGTSWIQLTKFSETPSYLVYTDAWTNGYEAFVLGHTVNGWPQKTVIWRGK